MQISTSQKAVMLQFLKERPFLITRRKQKTVCKPAELQLAWMELSDKVNSVPGIRKEWIFWRQLWLDMSKKALAKRRRIQYRKQQNLPCPDTLSTEELKIIAVIKQSFASKKSNIISSNNFSENINNGKNLSEEKIKINKNVKHNEREFSDVESLLSENLDVMAFIEDKEKSSLNKNKNFDNEASQKNYISRINEKTIITAQSKEEKILNVCEKCVNLSELELLHIEKTQQTPKLHKLVNISNRNIHFKNDKIEIITPKKVDSLKSVTMCNGHDYFRAEYNNVANVNSEIISTNDHKTVDTETISNGNILEDKFRKPRLLKQKFVFCKNKLEVKKIQLLERLVVAKERCATANEQSALAKGNIARNLYHLANKSNKKQSS